jgi:hypothetical protein
MLWMGGFLYLKEAKCSVFEAEFCIFEEKVCIFETEFRIFYILRQKFESFIHKFVS